MIHFIRSFLEDIKFLARIGETLSDEHMLQESVPQGIVLSCTLFLMNINNIEKNLPQHLKLLMYVENLVLYIASRNLTSAKQII